MINVKRGDRVRLTISGQVDLVDADSFSVDTGTATSYWFSREEQENISVEIMPRPLEPGLYLVAEDEGDPVELWQIMVMDSFGWYRPGSMRHSECRDYVVRGRVELT